MLSCVGGRGEHVWERVLLARWRARRTSAPRNLIWEGRHECCSVREDVDEWGNMCAQQGDSSWPKPRSLIAWRFLLPRLCQWSMIPDFFPWRFFLHVQRSSSRSFKKRTPGASWWFHHGPKLLSWWSHCRWAWAAQSTGRYPEPGLAEHKSFWDQRSSSVVWGEVGLILLSFLYSYCFQRSYLWPSPGAEFGWPIAGLLLTPVRTHFSQNWAHSKTSMGRVTSAQEGITEP